MIRTLRHLIQKSEDWFQTHPNLIILLLTAPYLKPFGLSIFHTLWPIEALTNVWGLLAFAYVVGLCWTARLHLGRCWWLTAFVCAVTAVSTLMTAWNTVSFVSLTTFVVQSNILDVLGMTGQALGLAAAACLCATKTSWYRLFTVLFYILAAILIINTVLLFIAPEGILSMSFVGDWHRTESPILFIGNRNFLYIWHIPLLGAACALDALRNLNPCNQLASPHSNQRQIEAVMSLLKSPLPPVSPVTKLRCGVSLRTWATAIGGLMVVHEAGSQTTFGALFLYTLLSLGILIYHASFHRYAPRIFTAMWKILSNPWVHFGCYLGVSGGFVLFRIQNHQPFAYLIQNIMGRNTTLTYRTEIWDATMSLITTPWYASCIGHGHLSGTNMAQFFMAHGFEHGYHVSEWVHVHNDLLQTLFSAGWLGLIASVAALAIATHAIKRMRQLAFLAIIGATICAFMVVMITETYMGSPLITFVVIASYLFTRSHALATVPKSAQRDTL